MTRSLTPAEFLELARRQPVLDVRSPGEFEHGHIHGAVNLPLFSDDERAEVGTTYKRRGREAAVELGMQLVTPKIPSLLSAARSAAPTSDVLVHCWRGGMRSAGVAQLLDQEGFQTRTLQGGYKAYRRHAHRCFEEPRRVIVLSGLTGSGKTQLLLALRERGEQVVDLEGLVRHRGSAFGAIGQPPQPTVEQFENDLFVEWSELDPERVVWMESENHVIGGVPVPDGIWEQLISAPTVFLDVSRAARVDFLVDEYGRADPHELEAALHKIAKRLGGERLHLALEALAAGDLHTFTDVVLKYYDKAYDKARQKRPQFHMRRLSLSRSGDTTVLPELCRLANLMAAPSVG